MHISEDVARLVFEHTNVDGLVALSQTCRGFRAAFLELDGLVGKKVQQCSPWMVKSTDNSDGTGNNGLTASWATSALVCAARNRAANNEPSWVDGKDSDNNDVTSGSWIRAPSDQSLNKDNYATPLTTGQTIVNPSRQELKRYNGTFGDIRLPYQHNRTIVRDGHIHLRYTDYPANNLDFFPYSLDLKTMTVVPNDPALNSAAETPKAKSAPKPKSKPKGRTKDKKKPKTKAAPAPPAPPPPATEKHPDVQLLDFGSESRDSFVSPYSGIKVVSATPTNTGNRYPAHIVFYEDIMFIDENETVMIVAKRCVASTRHEAFYVYKPDAKIVGNTLKFNFIDWKQSAMDPLMPPQLIQHSSYVAIVKKIGDSNWACIEHASKKDTDLIQLMKMDGRLFSVQVYNGLLYVYKGDRLYPIWVNLNEKRKLLFNYLLPDEKDQYTVCEVKPAFKKGWKAPGGWKSSRAVPWLARGGANDRFVTVGDFKKGGGYVVANLETGGSWKTQFPYRGENGKPDFVLPSTDGDSVEFFLFSQVFGRKLMTELFKIFYTPPVLDQFDGRKETAKVQRLLDNLVSKTPLSDSEDDWEHYSDENSDNERRIEMLSRPPVLPADIYGDDDDDDDDSENEFAEDEWANNMWARVAATGDVGAMSDNEWARATLSGDIPDFIIDQFAI